MYSVEREFEERNVLRREERVCEREREESFSRRM
jgi:hypothetical protein